MESSIKQNHMRLKKTEIVHCEVNTALAKLRWNLYRIPKFKCLRNFFYWKIHSIMTLKSHELSSSFKNTAKKRILILRPDHIGDLLLSLPALVNFLQSLGAEFSVEILINPCNTNIVRALSIFDKAYVFKITDDQGGKLLPSFDEYVALSKEVGKIDYLIDIRSDAYNLYLLDWLTPNYEGGLLIQNYYYPQKISTYNFVFFLNVAKKMKLIMNDNFETGVKSAALLLQKQFPKKSFQKPLILFCPEARNNKKTWGLSESIKFINALNERFGDGFIIALVGAKPNIKLNIQNIIDFRGKTDIFEAFCLVGSAKLFVGFDSGLTHFSSLVGVQTISIFTGRTDPSFWASIPSADNLSIIAPQNNTCPNHQVVMDKINEMINK